MALKKARRAGNDAGLNITSMMDMMTIILVFLLKSYSAQDISVAPSEDLQLPVSTTTAPPEVAVNLVVTKTQIFVDGQPIKSENGEVVRLKDERDPRNPGQTKLVVPATDSMGDPLVTGQLIIPLHKALEDKSEVAKKLAEKISQGGVDEHGFKGRLLIQCDKKLPFSILREVMYTAGQAQFSEFKFVVYKQE